jgi:UDP-N-acetylmuramoyl-L-alanyl-D-glutamate--2,6-diaminopimelate ligase
MATFKNSRFAKLFYNFPGAVSAYHFVWAWTGASLHRYPKDQLIIIGVTGTKGKTTTLEVINAVLEAAGEKTALLSSLRVKMGEQSSKNEFGNSMPGHGYLQSFLRRAQREGCRYALIEVTSQGVVLHRHRFIKWDMGVLTNLAPEHIESHGSFENYRSAKLAFLEYVFKQGGRVFLNEDDKNFNFFFESLAAHMPTHYSKQDETVKDVLPRIQAAREASGGADGATQKNVISDKFLLSEFNQENIAVAAAIAKNLGIDAAIIEKAILNFQGVPGRMEFVKAGAYTAVVDYAHTPDSLEAAYKAVKPKPSEVYSSPRLICILGAAGGGRDKWKRPAMGAIAAQYCDEIILTDEDPYNEDPAAIVQEVKEGIDKNGAGADAGAIASASAAKNIHIILDRKAAIKKAFDIAREGDIIIGTGKGSEDWIHVAGGKKIPWNERQFFEEAMAEKTGGAKTA